jgi:hypothetical protein
MKRKVMIILLMMMTTITALVAQNQPAADTGTHKGKVISTLNSSGYTYVEFEENGKKLWAATSQFKVSVGDIIEFSKAAPMENFHSKTLNKTFAVIFFANSITVEGSAPSQLPGNALALPEGHRPIGGKALSLPEGHVPIGKKSTPSITVEPGSITKAPDGYTIAECYSMKDSLKDKIVHVRARVVKFTPRIMGTNWIHLQDGTGEKGSNDLTVTSKDTVKVGDLLVASGKIVYDRDFGAGYVYAVIIEDAALAVE